MKTILKQKLQDLSLQPITEDVICNQKYIERILNNITIAEFMGYKESEGNFLKSIIDTCHECDLKFHSSWDWLMPVVEKIESLQLGNIKNLLPDDEHFNCCPGVEMDRDYCNIYIQADMRLVDNFIENLANTKLEATYITIIEFIEWYNKNK